MHSRSNRGLGGLIFPPSSQSGRKNTGKGGEEREKRRGQARGLSLVQTHAHFPNMNWIFRHFCPNARSKVRRCISKQVFKISQQGRKKEKYEQKLDGMRKQWTFKVQQIGENQVWTLIWGIFTGNADYDVYVEKSDLFCSSQYFFNIFTKAVKKI